MKQEFRTHFERLSSDETSGQLNVGVEGYEYQSLPIEVRDEDLRLLGMAMTGQTLTLSPGQYAIRLLLPDGEDKTSLVDIPENGGHQDFLVRVRSSGPSGRGSAPLGVNAVRSGKALGGDISAGTRGPVPVRHATEGTEMSEGWFQVDDWAFAAGNRKPGDWYVRLITYREGHWVQTGRAPAIRVTGQRYLQHSLVSEMEVEVHARGLHFLELVSANYTDGAVTIGLPVAGGTEAGHCRLVVTDSGEEMSAAATLLGYEGSQFVSEYIQNGALQEAAALMREAEDMLFGKMTNPVAAALGGYALLRLGKLKRLHNWPMNLAAWFEWLPDGAVISAELMARRGDHPSAANFLLLAVKRGLPLFSEGMSILMSRLRYYSLYARKKLGEGYSERHIEEGLAAVQQWSAAVDLSDIMLTLKGVSLTGQVLNIEAVQTDDTGSWLRIGQLEPVINEGSRTFEHRVIPDEPFEEPE